MHLQYIDDKKIDNFVKRLYCPNVRNIIVPDSNERNYVNVFTNLLSTTLHITDYECVNIDTGTIYSKQWHKFMIETLDQIDSNLSDQYINGLHDFLEQDTIYGPIL